eukprot:1146885-Pelagomonas_calceolata.AAC.4
MVLILNVTQSGSDTYTRGTGVFRLFQNDNPGWRPAYHGTLKWGRPEPAWTDAWGETWGRPYLLYLFTHCCPARRNF